MGDGDDVYGQLWSDHTVPPVPRPRGKFLTPISLEEFDPLSNSESLGQESNRITPEPPSTLALNSNLIDGPPRPPPRFQSRQPTPNLFPDDFPQMLPAVMDRYAIDKLTPDPFHGAFPSSESVSISSLNLDTLPKKKDVQWQERFDGESLEDLSYGEEATELEASSPPSLNTMTLKDIVPIGKGELFILDSGRVFTSWKKRWVLLQENECSIYVGPKSHVSKLIIPSTIMLNVVWLETPVPQSSDVGKFKFRLQTTTRDVIFGHPDLTEATKWIQKFMQVVIAKKKPLPSTASLSLSRPSSVVLKGPIKIEGVRSKRYFVLEDGVLSYYDHEDSYKASMPIHRISMDIAKARRSKDKLQLHLPYRTYNLSFDSESECNTWLRALEKSTQEMLNGPLELTAYANPSNRYCADCSQAEPQWSSISVGVTLCDKCAGVHRSFSRVWGIHLDTNVWTKETFSIIYQIGNNNANAFWEGNMPPEAKIGPDADEVGRRKFIVAKYKDKRYAQLHPLALQGKATELSEELCHVVQTEDLLETMRCLFSGANVQHRSASKNLLPYELAEQSKRRTQMAYLEKNGGFPTNAGTSETKDYRDFHYFSASGISGRGQLTVALGAERSQQSVTCVLEKGVVTLTPQNGDFPTEQIYCCDMTVMSGKDSYQLLLKKSQPNSVVLINSFGGVICEEWKLLLSRSFCPISYIEKLVSLDYAGWAALKTAQYGEWSLVWIVIFDRQMIIYNELTQSCEELDLRTMTNLSINEELTPRVFSVQPLNAIILSLPQGNYYLKGETEAAHAVWFKALGYAWLTVGHTLKDQLLTQNGIPVVVDKALKFLDVHGVHSRGIYRLSGAQARVRDLYSKFMKDPHGVVLAEGEWMIDEVAGCLKRFFRELADPPLTRELYPKWCSALTINDQSRRMMAYKNILGQLPSVNYNTIRRLMIHLGNIVENESETMMNASNLSLVFGTLLCSESLSEEDRRQYPNYISNDPMIVRDLINEYRWLFDLTEEEFERERIIRDKVRQIQEFKDKPPDKSLIISVFIENRKSESEDNSIGLKIEPTTTVETVMPDLTKKTTEVLTGLRRPLALFEIIVENEVERPLYLSENLYNVVLGWSNLDQDYINSAYLVMKENHIDESLETISGPDLAGLFLPVHYAERRSFRKCHIYLGEHDKIQLFKTNQIRDPIESWPINSMSVYYGLERKRKPPTVFGVTLLWPSDTNQTPNQTSSIPFVRMSRETVFFGRAFAFDSMKDCGNFCAALSSVKCANRNIFLHNPARVSRRYERQK